MFFFNFSMSNLFQLIEDYYKLLERIETNIDLLDVKHIFLR